MTKRILIAVLAPLAIAAATAATATVAHANPTYQPPGGYHGKKTLVPHLPLGPVMRTPNKPRCYTVQTRNGSTLVCR